VSLIVLDSKELGAQPNICIDINCYRSLIV